MLCYALVSVLHAEQVVSPDSETEKYLHHEKEDPKKKKSIIKTKKKFKDGDVEIALGGVIHPEMSIIAHQDFEGKNQERAGVKPHVHIGDSKIFFIGRYIDNSGWKAGYTFRFAPFVGDLEIDRSYAEFEHNKFGTLEIGCQRGVHYLLGRLAQTNMATAWMDGGLGVHLYEPGFAFTGNDLVGHTKVATKLNWISPSMKGFKIALSYTPSTKSVGKGLRNDVGFEKSDSEKGNSKIWDKKNKEGTTQQPFGRHNTTLLALYDHRFGDVNLTLAGAFIMDKSYFNDKFDVVNDVRSGMVSGELSYKDVSLGVEFLNSGKSRLPKEGKGAEFEFEVDKDGKKVKDTYVNSIFAKGDAGKSINATLSWEINKRNDVSIGYQHTWRHFGEEGKGTKNMFSLGYGFKILECVSWQTELDYVTYKVDGSQKDMDAIKDLKPQENKGFLILTGLRIEI